ncbi:MAG: MarC family protein [Candidatus Thermoplasmatota archaeon]|jgi:multiple antibiotic resistance protein|nr:MarC family protein [Candidatus Thermoplasmatota archaeon]
MDYLTFAISSFAAIFAIVDPLTAIPFFLALTENFSKNEKYRVILRSTTVAIAILLVFALIGKYIFLILNFTTGAFKIAGGIILFMVAMDMIHGERSKTKLTEKDRDEALSREEVGVVPLGIPLLAGPGAITTVMIYMSYASGNAPAIMILFGTILFIGALTYIIFSLAGSIYRIAGRTGILVFSRVMGLLLAAISIQFIIDGILLSFKI